MHSLLILLQHCREEEGDGTSEDTLLDFDVVDLELEVA